MSNIIQRLESIAEDDRKSLSRHLKEFGEIGGSSMIILDHRFLAVADYIKTKDVKIFREHLSKAAGYQLELFKRAKAGERISESYVDIYCFKHLLTALASGDYTIFKKFKPYVEHLKSPGHPFTKKFFRVLRDFVCEDSVDLKGAIEDMKEYFAKKEKASYGYALAFEAIENKDKRAFEEAFSLILKNHKRIGEFRDSEDEVIALWPLALINLARFKGLDVHADNFLIPKELIIQ